MGQLRNGLDDLDTSGQKGDWCFSYNNEYMFIKYGDGWSDTCCIKLQGTGKWEWNGNRESPTISPSIKVSNKEKELWHGYMTDGKLRSVRRINDIK